jgi:Cdc6-like AAA superfamily ATPase
MPDEPAKLQKLGHVAQVFTPAAPIDQYRLFAGRYQQVRDVITAVSQRGMHVILFGERGVGKTSLANILSELLQGDGVQSLNSGTVNCDGADDFRSIWRKAFRELTIYNARPSLPGFQGTNGHRDIEEATLDQWLSDQVAPDDIRYHLDRVPQPVIIVIDEIDRVQDKATMGLMADTIKTLSDHSVDATLVLVGVGNSVDELISEHQSVERALRQIRMPRMSSKELAEVLDKGLGELGMTMDPSAAGRITSLSKGLPAYTHLLALEATQRAVIDDRQNVTMEDVKAAMKAAVEYMQQSLGSAYHQAVSSSHKESLFAEVLLACALAPTDFLGFFSAADVREPMTAIMGRQFDIPAFSRHLNDFAEAARGPVLHKTGTARRFRFRFINPMMQPFVVLHGLANDLVGEETVQQLEAKQG